MNDFDTEALAEARKIVIHFAAVTNGDTNLLKAKIDQEMIKRHNGADPHSLLAQARVERIGEFVRTLPDVKMTENGVDAHSSTVGRVVAARWEETKAGIMPGRGLLRSQTLLMQGGHTEHLTEAVTKKMPHLRSAQYAAERAEADLRSGVKTGVMGKQGGRASIGALVTTAALGLAATGLAHAQQSGLVDMSGVTARLKGMLGADPAAPQPSILAPRKPDNPKL